MFTLKVISAWSRQCLFRCGLARIVLRWYVLIWGCRHYGHYYFVSLILSHLVFSLILKHYCSGYLSSSVLEQKSFSKEEVSWGRYTYWMPTMFQALPPRTSEDGHYPPCFTEEETEIRDQGARSWQSWDLNVNIQAAKLSSAKRGAFQQNGWTPGCFPLVLWMSHLIPWSTYTLGEGSGHAPAG